MVEKLKLTSASGLLALLEEEQNALKAHALKSLITVVDDHWAEVAGSISLCEALYEDDEFPERDHAALLASKVRVQGVGKPLGFSTSTPLLLGEHHVLRIAYGRNAVHEIIVT
jgi:26S proteasome regulatory subunit N2